MKFYPQYCLFILLSGSVVLSGCARKTIATNTKPDTAKANQYQEDLSAVRPKYLPETAVKTPVATPKTTKPNTATSNKKINLEVTDRLNLILDTIAVRNKIIKSAPGFRVQIYVGDSREEALAARARSYSLLRNETPYLIPTLPSYRVRVGDFLDRLEAQKAYTVLLREFPTALVVPDKIEIKRFANEDK